MYSANEFKQLIMDEYQRQVEDPSRKEYYRPVNAIKMAMPMIGQATLYKPGEEEHVITKETAKALLLHRLNYVMDLDDYSWHKQLGRRDSLNMHVTKGSAFAGKAYGLHGTVPQKNEQLANAVLNQLHYDQYTLECLSSMSDHTFQCLIAAEFTDSRYNDITARHANYNGDVMTSAEMFELSMRLYGATPSYELASTTLSSTVLKRFKADAIRMITPQGFSAMSKYMDQFLIEFAAPYVARSNIRDVLNENPDYLIMTHNEIDTCIRNSAIDSMSLYHASGYQHLFQVLNTLSKAAETDTAVIDETLPVYESHSLSQKEQEEEILYKLRCHKISLVDIENQTEEMCMLALNHNIVFELDHVKVATDAIIHRLENLSKAEARYLELFDGKSADKFHENIRRLKEQVAA